MKIGQTLNLYQQYKLPQWYTENNEYYIKTNSLYKISYEMFKE